MLAAVALAMTAGWAAAATAPPPLEAYGQLPAIEMISLSPSGQYMVSVGDVSGKRYLLVRSLAGEVRLAVSAEGVKVRDITWVDDGHVLVTVSQTGENYGDLGRQEYFAIISIDTVAGKSHLLFDKDPRFIALSDGLVATYVIGAKPYAFVWNVPREGAPTGSRLSGRSDAEFTRWWPDLYRIDLTSNQVDLAAKGNPNIESWAVNPDGGIAGYSNFYPNTSDWRLYRGETELMARSSPRQLTRLWGLGRSADTMLVFDQSGVVDQWIEIGGGGHTQVLWPGDNVTGVLRDPVTGLVTGAEIDDSSFKFFDSGLQANIDAATKPFKGRIVVDSTTSAVDKVILHTDGAGDSGTYYLVDLRSHRADIIANDYADVPADQVGEVRGVNYTAADGMALDGVLTLPPGRPQKNLPLVVLPHGGPIGPYDQPHFDWMAQAFASSGYAVFQPNYRGSGGHGASFQNAGFGEWGRKMLSDISDGVNALAQQGVIDPKRACIVGFSYGGYAALAGVTVQQGRYRCAVSGSGVSDLPAMLKWEEDRYGAGSADDKFWKEAMGVTVPGSPPPASVSPAKLAARADAPVLLIHGTDDSVVPIVQSQEMLDALQAAHKPVEYLITQGEDHWLSKSETRVLTLKAAIDFVERYNPAD